MLSCDPQRDGGGDPNGKSVKKESKFHNMNMNIYSCYTFCRETQIWQELPQQWSSAILSAMPN